MGSYSQKWLLGLGKLERTIGPATRDMTRLIRCDSTRPRFDLTRPDQVTRVARVVVVLFVLVVLDVHVVLIVLVVCVVPTFANDRRADH